MADLYNFRLGKGGDVLTIDDGAPFAVLEEDGLTMSPVGRIRERGPQQHGATDRGFRLDPRPINLVLAIFFEEADEFWTHRETLLSYLAPYNAPYVDVILSNGETRRLDVDLISMVMGSKDREGQSQTVGVQLEAPDPSMYDPTGAGVTFDLGGGSGGWTVPMPIPLSIGSSEIDQTIAITYEGTWRTHPILRITGPLTDPVVTQETTDETLDFTGTTIDAGDYLEIDTRYGQKSVMDQDGVNQIALLSEDSDLGTFHLEPDGAGAPGGVNVIRVEGTGANSASKVEINYFVRYLGI